MLIGFDQICKSLSTNVILNHGFFFGSFSWSTSFYRIFCTTVLLALSVLLITLAQYFVSKSYRSLTLALGLFEAGLIGNGLDKIFLGAVRDFLPLRFGDRQLTLNISDLYQWAALIWILILIWKHPDRLWPRDNKRFQWLTFPHSQFKIISVLLLVTLLVVAINILLFLAYLNEFHSGISAHQTLEFFMCFGLFTAFTALIIGIFGAFWSNQIYGPFRAVERYLQIKKNGGDVSKIKFRMGDERQCVEEILHLLEKK